eukprot:jgi/Ulvmu1/3574/UM168_0006.1
MASLLFVSAVASVVAVAGQRIVDIWPDNYQRYNYLELENSGCDDGRVTAGGTPRMRVVALHRNDAARSAAALEIDLDPSHCSDHHDVLAMTFFAPVMEPLDPADIELEMCQHREGCLDLADDDYYNLWPVGCRISCRTYTPDCIMFQPGDEENERQTVLVGGQFKFTEPWTRTHTLAEVTLQHRSTWVDGQRLGCDEDDAVSRLTWHTRLSPDGEFFGMGEGPYLTDIAFHNLSAPLNTAAADANGCAALHPSATYAIRLIFDSGMRESSPNGSLVPFASSSAAAAMSIFSLRRGPNGGAASPDTLVGLADIDEDNVVDLCVAGIAAGPRVDGVIINCTAGDVRLLSAMGDPCDGPIRAFTHTDSGEPSWKPNGEGLDGQRVKFCLARNGDCSRACSMHASGAVLVAAALALLQLAFTDLSLATSWL